MPVLGERERLASAGVEGAPCQCRGRGRALPVLGEMAPGGEGAPCQCWGIGRALPVLGDRAWLVSAWGIGRALPVLG